MIFEYFKGLLQPIKPIKLISFEKCQRAAYITSILSAALMRTHANSQAEAEPD